ncbi:MAG: LacI family DNA-binding transcriptional regulator [Lachnospiraceae bacterium]|nr:LacI family DNA-binding transcriptional regulator [Lachnospiraceae bacterium]
MAETTIKDIAKECGVGVSTVSRALNNHPDINPETREKIMKVIRETGFVPNNSARNLKRSDARSIALIVKGISNPFFSDMIRIMENYAQTQRYTTILRHVEPDEDEVNVALQLVKECRLRGIVFLGGNFTHDNKKLKLINAPFIFTTIGSIAGDAHKKIWYSNIAVDDRAESCKLVSYLIGLGHRNIALITEGLGEPSVGKLRYEGYRDALEQHGIPFDEKLVMEVDQDREPYSMKNGYNAAKRLLNGESKFTAIFCEADILAIGACRAVFDKGLKVPHDISVVGYDGIEMGNYYRPRLTTIKQPVEEMAEEGIKLLFSVISGKSEHRNIIMPAELLLRESSSEANEARE